MNEKTNIITVNGIDYVKADTVITTLSDAQHVIVIAPNGWIFVGQVTDAPVTENGISLLNASVVRRWTNGKGIGGLIKEANKSEYTLDPCGSIHVHNPLVTIGCEW